MFRRLTDKETTTPAPRPDTTEETPQGDLQGITEPQGPETTTESPPIRDEDPDPLNVSETTSLRPVWSDEWMQFWSGETRPVQRGPDDASPPNGVGGLKVSRDQTTPRSAPTRKAPTPPPGCPAVHVRQRWRRQDNGGGSPGSPGSTTPKADIGYLGGLVESVYPADEDTLNKRIEKKVENTNAVDNTKGGVISPPAGVDPMIQTAWSARQWETLAQKIDAGTTQVVTKADNKPTWSPVAKMKVYDQYITVQLTTLLSGALDAISDAAYHINSDKRMRSETFTDDADPVRDLRNTGITGNTKSLSLKSPRGHPEFGKGAANGIKRVEQFPLITHASVDHLIDINTRKVRRCWNLTTQALKALGPPVKSTGTTRPARGALMDRLTVGVATVAGLFGIGLFGLGGQTAQLTSTVKGLESDVHSIRQKTGALLRAEGAMKEYAHKALKVNSQWYGALRKGLLVETTANAACETARSIQRVAESLEAGKIPFELFRSTGELKNVTAEIKEGFLEPLGLHFLLDDDQLLLKYFCEGYIQEQTRKTALQEGAKSEFAKGSLGYPWVNKQGTQLGTVPGGVTESDAQEKVRVGIDGNTFRKYATHLVHSEGMRANFLTTTLDLVTKIQVPVAQTQGPCWEQLKLDNNLFVIEGEPYQLEETHTVFRSTNAETPSDYKSIPTAELKYCNTIKGIPLITCPRERIRKRGVCEEELMKGKLNKDCLHKLRRWDSTRPFIQQRGRSLEFIVYVPTHMSLVVTCPQSPRREWSAAVNKGLLVVVPPPFCTLHLGELHHLVVAGMVKARTRGNFQGDMLDHSVQSLAHLMDIEWGEIQEAIHRLEEAHVTLQEVFSEARKTPTDDAWSYIRPRLWGVIATLLALIALTGGTVCVLWIKQHHRGLWEELQDNVSRLLGMDEVARVNNQQKTQTEMKELRRRIDGVEQGQEKVSCEVSFLKDMGSSLTLLNTNALRGTFDRPREANDAANMEAQPLVPITIQPQLVRSVLTAPPVNPGGRAGRRQ